MPEDREIVALYWEREESAIQKTQEKYSRYLTKIVRNILPDPEDQAECVNDVYLKAWSSMPPHRPEVLSTYLGKLARETAIDRYRKNRSQKRGMGEYALSLSELAEVLPDRDTTVDEAESRRLDQVLDAWLRTLPGETRKAFVSRYFYADPVKDIAACLGASESKVKSMLFRARKGLRKRLTEEGFSC
ncbi:MAG: sigma-70 family RNA polymerase sigma factor [Oscillospiraceae bacterium]|nr:sigma-70 family RNA polymerase sigma factor [Oscillospiraceae bacterium]